MWTMIGISTSYISSRMRKAAKLVQSLSKLSVNGVELEYRIQEATYRQMIAPLKDSRLRVFSIHNFFPNPPTSPNAQGSGDLFLLSSPDRDMRSQAIKATVRSIEIAADWGAAAVVLHCGKVQIVPQLEELHRYWRRGNIQSEAAQAFIQRQQSLIAKAKPVYLNSLIRSLDKLVVSAEKYGVKLGLENRFHYHELPGAQDFQTIFQIFTGSPLGYWHDTGHAHANEMFTFLKPNELLNAYAKYIIGIHLHDAVGIDDHLPPGTGEINFDHIRALIPKDTICILELKPGTGHKQLIKGIQYLKEKGFN